MLTAAQENALYTWFYGSTGLTTVWKSQGAPVPAFPYGLLGVLAGPVRESGLDYESHAHNPTGGVGANLTTTLRGHRLYTINCDVRVATDVGGANAQYYLSKAEQSLELPCYHLALLQAGIAVVNISPPQDLDETVNQQDISRASMDVQIRIMSELSDGSNTFIETVNASGVVGNITLTSSINEDTFMSHYGELILGTPAASTVSVPGTYVDVAGTFAIDNSLDMSLDGSNGLEYDGSVAKYFLVRVSGILESDTITKAHLKLAVDGTVDDNTLMDVELESINTEKNFSMDAIIALAENEVLTLKVTADDACDITVQKCIIVAAAA